MSFRKVERDSLRFPGEVKKVGTGFFIPISKKYMEMLGISEDNMDLMQLDVTVEVMERPVEVEEPIEEEED